MKRLTFLSQVFLLMCISNISQALTIIDDNQIDVQNDIIVINTEINTDSVNATVLRIHELQNVNTKSNKPIYLLLDSPGGEVVEGARIIDAMTASKRPIYTVAVGGVYSMAAYIHSYGVKRYMLPNAVLMYHLASTGFQGNTDQMVSRLNILQRIIGRMNKNICSRSDVTLEELNNKESKEWWVDSDEALSRKLIEDTIASTAFYIPKASITINSFPWLPKK